MLLPLWTRSLFLVMLLLSLAGCLPDIRTDLALPNPPYRMEPRAVSAEYLSVPGYEVPDTPQNFNKSFYLRYFSAAPTRTVLLLVPGIYAGAANFDIVARQLVAAWPGLEVWAVDRRSNALEDRSALMKSLRANDPEIAYRYYVTGRDTPAGFSTISPEQSVSEAGRCRPRLRISKGRRLRGRCRGSQQPALGVSWAHV